MLNKDTFESTSQVTYVRPTYQKAIASMRIIMSLLPSSQAMDALNRVLRQISITLLKLGGWMMRVSQTSMKSTTVMMKSSNWISCLKSFCMMMRKTSVGANTATTAMKNFPHALHRYCWIYKPTLTHEVSTMAQMDMTCLLIQTIGTLVPSWRQ